MRERWLWVLLVGIWAMAPIAGSPASLVVMPIIAAVTVWAYNRLRDAVLAAVATMAPVALGYSLVTFALGQGGLLDQLATGAGIFAMHAVAVAILVALGWGLARLAKRVADQPRPG